MDLSQKVLENMDQDTGEDAVIMWKYFEFYENYKEEE